MDIAVYIQNAKGEFVYNVAPLEYTNDFDKAACVEFPADATEHDDNMSAFEDNFIKDTLKTLLENEPKPLQNWTLLYYYDGTPYYKIEITGEGSRVSSSMNPAAHKDAYVDKFCRESLNVLYDYILDLFGPHMIKSSLSSVIDAAASAMGGSAPSFSKSDEVDTLIEKIQKETKAEIVKPKETISDYVCDDVLTNQLTQIIDFFDNRKRYVDAGIEIPKGVLFKGPPGTGKTYAARCIAGTVDCYFMICTASSLQGMYIGSGAANIKAVFKGARMLSEKSGKGVIVFIDELDSVGTRGDTSGAGDEVNRTINQLLAEMSGFNDDENIMVMGATNFVDSIDPALLRSGRFSRQITIDYPDDTQREEMLKHYANKLKIKVDWDSSDASMLTKTFTPADIKEVVNAAAIKAVRSGSGEVSLDDLNESINEVITKDIRKPDNTKALQLVTAHECGHVLEEVITKGTIPTKVTNYAYGDAGGFTQPSEILTGIVKQSDLIKEVKILLAGRAAEEIIMHYVTTGASNDLDKAKSILRGYYVKYNFESYETEKIDQLILDKLNQLYAEVLDDIRNNKDSLNELINALSTQRVLYSSDIALHVVKLISK